MPASDTSAAAGVAAAMPEFDLARWQAALDANRDVFADLAPGASIGLVDEAGMHAPPCPMLVWERTAAAQDMVAKSRPFEGFADACVDLLLVARNDAFGALQRDPGGDAIERLGELVGAGEFVFFVFRTRDELQDRGLEGLIEILGISFIGACR